MKTEEVPLFRALQGDRVRDVEMMIIPQEGSPRRVVANGQPIFDERGEKLGAVVALHDITEGTRIVGELAHRALHDELTGLPNRALLLDRLRLSLSRMSRRSGSVVVLFVDLDHFKVVNDSLGHVVGDGVLVAVADRLRSVIRQDDTASRFGGDEFVLVCEDVRDPVEAAGMAERVQGALAAGFTVAGREMPLTASIGITVAEGPEREPEDLLRDADTAMYRAKDRGRARYEIFDEHLREAALARLDIQHDLRHALGRDQLRLWFQPVVSVADGRLVGAEALLRWLHPTRGVVPPLDFIHVAEQTGMIIPMGSWVLEEACRQLDRWRDTSTGRGGLSIAVNLSARQLAWPGLQAVVAKAIAASMIESGDLCLEITESVLMDDPAAAAEALGGLKDLGVVLAIDDFGTGYSSLSYLKRFPVDILKIDRSFISGLGRDDDDSTIVRAVIRLAHNLRLTVIAEGVETEEQRVELDGLGCELAQGYLFSRPLEAEGFAALPDEPLRPRSACAPDE